MPFQNLPTADGWIVVACPKEKFWQLLTEVIGKPELATETRFANFAARYAHTDELLVILEGIFTSQPSAHWLTRLQAAGIPCAPVNSVAEALTDPHTKARRMIVDTTHPHFGTVQSPASPVRVGDAAPSYRRAPSRHEDAPDILSALLQYSPGQVHKLTQDGAFGTVNTPKA